MPGRARYLMSLVNHMRLICTSLFEYHRFATFIDQLSDLAMHNGASLLPNLGTLHLDPLVPAERLLSGLPTSRGLLHQVWALSCELPSFENLHGRLSVLPCGDTQLRYMTVIVAHIGDLDGAAILNFIGQQKNLCALKLDVERHYGTYAGEYVDYVRDLVTFCYACCGASQLPALRNIKIMFSNSRFMPTNFVESLMQRSLDRLAFTNNGKHVSVEIVRV